MYTIDAKVIVILIICATIIALTAIICDLIARRRNDSNNPSECHLSKRIIKIHRSYIIGFLGFAVVMLITAQYGGPNNEIFSYLSFASTITSLVLSILAIFVTVKSSMDLNKQFGSVNTVSKQIDDTLKKLNEAESKLNETSNNISNQVNTIAEEVEKRLVPRFDKSDELMSNMSNLINGNNSQQNREFHTDNQIDKEIFLSETPRYGLYSLYACVLSKEKNKHISLSDIFDDRSDQMYALGFIAALKSSDLLRFDKFNRNNILCNYSLFTKDEIISTINNEIEIIKEDETKKRNLTVFNKIKNFFGEV